MKRRSLALILAAALLLGAGALAANVGSFTDVDSGAWYADAVKYVTEEGLFNGKTDTLFAPGDTMTRGMFVTVLGRYADVDPDIWIEGEITASGVNVRSTASTEGSVVAVLTTGDTARGLAWLAGEGGIPAVPGLLSALNGILAVISALSVSVCLALTVRVRYNRACLAAFALSFVSLWLWLALSAAMLVQPLI